jgi:lactate dehydrogenase-like 2-hydroxyacid dehydrogenase
MLKSRNMRVVAYSIKTAEKEPLAIANHKKHEITLISNSLSAETAFYAKGKDAVVVFTDDDVSDVVIGKLADLGIRYIATRSTGTTHIDSEAAGSRNIRIANVPHTSLMHLNLSDLPMALAVETIRNLDKWQTNSCLGDACVCSKTCDQVKFAIGSNHHDHEH